MSTPALAHHTCHSCGAELAGGFCSACGEPVVHDGDLSIRHLTHDFLHEFTHLDGKIWRTLKALLLRPGLLTAEYWGGRRGAWIRPLRLFLVISALVLLAAPNAAGPLGLRIWVNNGHDYRVGTLPAGELLDHEMTHRVQAVYLWIRYLSLGMFASASLLLYRKRQRYYGAHVIFGMHYYAFEYLLTGAIGAAWAASGPSIALPIGFVYLLVALRRLFGEGWVRTASKTVLLFGFVLLAEVVVVCGALLGVILFRGAGH